MDIKRFLVNFSIFLIIALTIKYLWSGYDNKPAQPTGTETTQVVTDTTSAPSADAVIGTATQITAEPASAGLHVKPTELTTDLTDKPFLGGLGADVKYTAKLTFNPATGSVESALANKHKYKVSDKEFGYPLLNSCQSAAGVNYDSFMVTSIKLEGYQKLINLSENCWQLLNSEPDTIKFSASIFDGETPLLDIIKVFTLTPESHDLSFSIEFINKAEKEIKVKSVGITGPAGLINDDPRSDRRGVVISYFKNNNAMATEHLAATKLKSSGPTDVKTPDNIYMEWFAQSNKFFTSIMRAVPADNSSTADFVVNLVQARPASLLTGPEELRKSDAMVLYTEIVPGVIAAGQKAACNYSIYIGAIDHELFETEQYLPMQYNLAAVNQSCAMCTFAWLNTALFKLMQYCYAVTGNYGISIIFLVFLVRLILHPITKKSQANMMQMSKMGPRIEEIKKTYANNQKEMQRQMALVYKEQGFTPILGCLPMFLQMPIWIALYTSVDSNIGLRHEGLFPAWIPWLNDLSAPDRLIPFSAINLGSITVPLLGHLDAFNLLPILLTIAMFFQSKASMNQSAAPTTPEAAQQQKMMLYMMPIMMLIFFYTAPSGLNLYIMASTFAGLIEQKRIKKHLLEKEQTQKEGVVVVTGKISERIKNRGKN